MINHFKTNWILFLIFLPAIYIFLFAKNQNSNQNTYSNSKLIQIPLEGELAEPYSEISGLTWYRDQLIILPQYPDKFRVNNIGSLFKISKNDIINWLNKFNPELKLSATRIEFDTQDVSKEIKGFQGFESVLTIENKMFLTIECIQDHTTQAYLVEGLINGDIEKIVLQKETLKLLPMPVQVINCSYESMIVNDHELYLIYEANGKNVNKTPQAVCINLDNGEIRLKPFPNVEYRITDATALDDKMCFWVINYYWPGDFNFLKPANDPLLQQTIPVLSFSRDVAIERLIELNYSEEGFKLSGKNPILVGLGSRSYSRNWEGIVRLDNRGFILATDKFPATILAFLAYP